MDAGTLLKQRGIYDYVLLETRVTQGDRIMPVSPTHKSEEQRISDQYDLGTSWSGATYTLLTS